MGIPSYFVHIVKNHRNVIKIFDKNDIKIDNLYIDSNSIIYDALRTIEYKDNASFEKLLITLVCEKVLYYINLINPTQRVMVAFDGVAPVAKMEQQRNRRYKGGTPPCPRPRADSPQILGADSPQILGAEPSQILGEILGAEPSLRLGAEPSLRLGAEPALRLGAEPALRLGAEPGAILEAEPASKPDNYKGIISRPKSEGSRPKSEESCPRSGGGGCPPWDTTACTPGTAFMETLYKEISKYFLHANVGLDKDLDIMISGSNDCGEGEHKIYSYIRDNKRYHHDTNTVIYGLDADLIMLTLIHTKISPNLYLFRETPHFITSIDKNLVPDQHYVLDIYELGEKLNLEMSSSFSSSLGGVKKPQKQNPQKQNPQPVPEKDCIYDYIFLCFFLGNDFMPHFPALNIRTNGISILIETYKNLFTKANAEAKDNVLIDDKKIYWKNLRRFVEQLAKNESVYLAEEMKTRERQERNTRNKRFANAEERLMATPLLDRTVERYINIGEDGWQARYYQELFGIEINDDRKRQICINYLEGLEWNFRYYTNDCPDWRWKYNYMYAPLLEDLCRFIPYFDTEFIQVKPRNPVQPLVQLAYVLPRNSLGLLPPQIRERLLALHPDWYRLDYDVQWAYCKYLWESHIVLPHIKIEELEEIVNRNRNSNIIIKIKN